MGKLFGARGALETQPGRLARAQGRRQETKKASRKPAEARWAWPQRPHAQGGAYAAHLRGRCRSPCLRRTLAWRL